MEETLRLEVIHRLAQIVAEVTGDVAAGENSASGIGVDMKNTSSGDHVTREIDNEIHNLYKVKIRTHLECELGMRVLVQGEEERAKVTFVEWRKFDVVVVVDPVDGTDLIARRLGNWCTALFAFAPKCGEIIGSVIGSSSGEIYFAARAAFKAYRNFAINRNELGKKATLLSLPLPESPTLVKNSSLCFVGQKAGRFIDFAISFSIFERQKDLRESHFRIYNFGGNPMLAKLSEGLVHIVAEVSGQMLHDFVPGAYIALQAGATIGGRQGELHDVAWLNSLVSKYGSESEREQYIITCTPELYADALRYITPPITGE